MTRLRVPIGYARIYYALLLGLLAMVSLSTDTWACSIPLLTGAVVALIGKRFVPSVVFIITIIASILIFQVWLLAFYQK